MINLKFLEFGRDARNTSSYITLDVRVQCERTQYISSMWRRYFFSPIKVWEKDNKLQRYLTVDKCSKMTPSSGTRVTSPRSSELSPKCARVEGVTHGLTLITISLWRVGIYTTQTFLAYLM